MRLRHFFGFHTWNKCKCTVPGCKAVRNQTTTGEEDHAWSGCKCSLCGLTRNEGHPPLPEGACKCKLCGRQYDHDYEPIGEPKIETLPPPKGNIDTWEKYSSPVERQKVQRLKCKRCGHEHDHVCPCNPEGESKEVRKLHYRKN